MCLADNLQNMRNRNFLEIFGELRPLVLRKKMIRKIIALVLLCLMMVATATSQPGLRYCLCLNEFFVTDCECAESCSFEEISESHDDACCSDHCDVVSQEESSESSPVFDAHSDCSRDIHFESSSFVEFSNQVRSGTHDSRSKEISSVDFFSGDSLACFLRSSIH